MHLSEKHTNLARSPSLLRPSAMISHYSLFIFLPFADPNTDFNPIKDDSMWESKINKLLSNITYEIDNICISSLESINIMENSTVPTLLLKIGKIILYPNKEAVVSQNKAEILLSKKAAY